jgi:hypothetical protein
MKAQLLINMRKNDEKELKDIKRNSSIFFIYQFDLKIIKKKKYWQPTEFQSICFKKLKKNKNNNNNN